MSDTSFTEENDAKCRARIGSDEEDYVESASSSNDDEEDDYSSLDYPLDFDRLKVNFPEAGIDLVDSQKFPSMESNLSQDSGIRLVDNTKNWEHNWLFKKHKENKSMSQYHLNSDIHFGYMALALDTPRGMLIPKPEIDDQSSQPKSVPLVGNVSVDELEDLSDSEASKNRDSGDIVWSSDDDQEDLDSDSSSISSSGRSKTVSQSSQPLHLDVYLSKSRSDLSNTQQTDTGGKLQRSRILLKRWAKLKVPEFVPTELRTISSSLPNSRTENLMLVPTLTIKPANAPKLHTGIVAQFVSKAQGLMPLHFAWYKDGALIACSGDNRPDEQIELNRLAKVYFGVRFVHKRYVESACSGYRLLVFNENECVLEIKRTLTSHSGVYSVVAYNHLGYDWCDFNVNVDRVHFNAVVVKEQLHHSSGVRQSSPRPVRRRPQNKHRNTKNIINELVSKLVNDEPLQVDRPSSSPAHPPKRETLPVHYRSSVSPRPIGSPESMAAPKVIRTWHQRQSNVNHDHKHDDHNHFHRTNQHASPNNHCLTNKFTKDESISNKVV